MEEMSDGRRSIIAIAISLLIVLAWGHFYKSPEPPAQKEKAAQSVPVPANTLSTPSSAPPAAPAAMAAAASGPPHAAQASEEKTVVIESSLYSVEFSNRGGVVRSWKLRKFKDDKNHVLDLVNPVAAQQLGEWPLSVVLDDPQLEARANSGLYVSNVSTAQTGAEAESNAASKPSTSHGKQSASEPQLPQSVDLHWSDGHLDIEKKFTFGDSYEVSAQVAASLDGKPLPVGLAWRGGFGDITAFNESQLVTVFYGENGKLNLITYKKLGTNGHPEERMMQAGNMNYAGIEDQFFTAAFLPDTSGLTLWDWVQQENITADGKTTQQPVAEMAAGHVLPGPVVMRMYVGPKDLDLLAMTRPPLEDLVNFGWTGIIAKPLLRILQWGYKYVPNYGWCIVLLTLAINTVLFPLKMSSWRSMQKMQRVAPEVKQIQDRYKKYSLNDPRKKKMNEEVMAVYNREGINPMGSCLPMVAQMPIWWALYRMLMSAIELRHAPWIGWIHDLSAHDPYYILPILMTLTMYLTQKMTPTAAVDPAQQKMTMYMPLLFGFLFFRLSSGLILYIFTSNLVGIAQQYYLNRTNPLPPKGKFQKSKAKVAQRQIPQGEGESTVIDGR